MNDLLLPSKRWEWRTAFGGNLLAILQSATHTAHNKYEVPNFYLGQSLYTQNKAHIFFLMSGIKFCPLDLKVISTGTKQKVSG